MNDQETKELTLLQRRVAALEEKEGNLIHKTTTMTTELIHERSKVAMLQKLMDDLGSAQEREHESFGKQLAALTSDLDNALTKVSRMMAALSAWEKYCDDLVRPHNYGCAACASQARIAHYLTQEALKGEKP